MDTSSELQQTGNTTPAQAQDSGLDRDAQGLGTKQSQVIASFDLQIGVFHMKCSTCGKMGCYEHGGPVKGVHRESYTRNTAGSESGDLVRDAHAMKRGSPRLRNEKLENAKAEHKRVLGESRALPKPKLKGLAKGGKVNMYAMEPDVPAMHGYAKGGEVDPDSDNHKYERMDPDKAAAAQRGAQRNEMDDIVDGAKSLFGNFTGMGAQAQPVEHKAEGGEVGGEDDELMNMCVDELKDGIKSGDNKQIIESLKAIFMSMKE